MCVCARAHVSSTRLLLSPASGFHRKRRVTTQLGETMGIHGETFHFNTTVKWHKRTPVQVCNSPRHAAVPRGEALLRGISRVGMLVVYVNVAVCRLDAGELKECRLRKVLEQQRQVLRMVFVDEQSHSNVRCCEWCLSLNSLTATSGAANGVCR